MAITSQLWYLTIKNLKSMIRDRVQLVWLFGYPFLFMLLYKFALGEDVFVIMAPSLLIIGPTVIVSQLASHFAEEKEIGTLQRLVTTPVSRSTILLSGLFSQLIIGAIQILILLLCVFLLGAEIHSDANMFLLIFIPFLVTFTSLGFGLLLASFVKSSGSAGGLAWFVILPLQFLGGGFSDKPIVEFLPTGLAAVALRSVWIDGIINFETVGINLIYTFIWGIAVVLIGIILFQRKTAIL